MADNVQTPERSIVDALQTGITAITGDTSVFTKILKGADASEVTKARNFWAAHPPAVRVNYPHSDTPLPCVCVILQGEDPSQEYLSQGEEARLLGLSHEGFEFKTRLKGMFGVYVFTQNPDSCVWVYRAIRRVLNVAARRLLEDDLQVQVLTGQDLIPDPQYGIAGVFCRRIMVALEFEERWDDQDAIWAAFYNEPTPHLPADGTVDLVHEDAGGGIHPYTRDDS